MKSAIICIHDGHNSSVSLMVDGEIHIAIQEERLSRRKNHIGFPVRALEVVLKHCAESQLLIDHVYFATINQSPLELYSKWYTTANTKDFRNLWHGDLARLVWQNKATASQKEEYKTLLALRKPKGDDDPYRYDINAGEEQQQRLLKAERIRVAVERIGVKPNNITFLDHHDCHAAYAYYGSPLSNVRALVLTMDGGGDGINLSLSIAEREDFRSLARHSRNPFGKFWKVITVLLSMRPHDDEFKVMGLAPYAKAEAVERLADELSEIFTIRDDVITISEKYVGRNLYRELKDFLEDYRFDTIAGAAQLTTELVICRYVRALLIKYDTKRLVFSGGTSMNVKLNKKLMELPEVEDFYCSPSGGDESLSVGGCYLVTKSQKPFRNIYVGSSVDTDQLINNLLNKDPKLIVIQKGIEDLAADCLRQGRIIGLISGQGEFGSRALGNRSIVANPRTEGIVRSINEAVKNRDFWMPFALSIMEEYSENYLFNPKKICSPYMTVAFDTIIEGRDEIKAGIHPYDFTCRAQILSKNDNPDFHRFIDKFRCLTKIPAVLNTSFNLHREPLVESVDSIANTFLNSNIHCLYINYEVLIFKGSC